MERHPHTRELQRLIEVLWTSRRLLDLLLYRLVSAKLVLAADEKRFVALAFGEVERAMEKIRTCELQRSLMTARLAGAWGVQRDLVTLVYLAEHAPEPARTAFEDHRDFFLAATAEIEAVALENKKLAAVGLSEVRELMAVVVGEEALSGVDAQSYTSVGGREVLTGVAYRVDKVM
jgi:hypothetical protein